MWGLVLGLTAYIMSSLWGRSVAACCRSVVGGEELLEGTVGRVRKLRMLPFCGTMGPAPSGGADAIRPPSPKERSTRAQPDKETVSNERSTKWQL